MVENTINRQISKQNQSLTVTKLQTVKQLAIDNEHRSQTEQTR